MRLNGYKTHMRAQFMEKEILTIEEAAAYLQIGKRSLYKLVKEGRIPGKKILNKWRFEKESLKEWIREGFQE
jgi:excisionase family DNA binding protein